MDAWHKDQHHRENAAEESRHGVDELMYQWSEHPGKTHDIREVAHSARLRNTNGQTLPMHCIAKDDYGTNAY